MSCRGRKRAALLYVATYSASCLTKHSPNYWVLLVGRLLGGIATSLLFSVFEAWAVAAHNNSGFPESLLGDLFTKVRRQHGRQHVLATVCVIWHRI